MKSLLVINNKILNLKLKDEFIRENLEVDSVFSALEAHNYLIRNDYQIVIIDCDLPDIDGFQVAKRLHEKSYDINIILISSEKCKEEQNSKTEAGNILYFSNSEIEDGIISRMKERNVI